MNNNKKQQIFILDDEVEIITMLKTFLNKKVPDADIYTFTKCIDMIEHPMIDKTCLFIIDIELNSILKGNEVAHELFKNKYNKPYLFMSGKDYKYKCFQHYDYIYDFIKKPFDLNKLLNRIAVLLKVGIAHQRYEHYEHNLKMSLKDLFDFTNIYMLILDKEMNIKSCSFKLARDLGFNGEDELVGTSWKKFLKEKDKTKLDLIHKNVVDDSIKYQKFLREVTNKIVTKSGSTITTKWFNSRISNGHTYTFSIGIPYNRKVTPEDDIDSIRAYWKYVLDKDDTTLKALKEVVT